MDQADLSVTSSQLTALADDLDDMQDHLTKQIRRMDTIVDTIEAGWGGSTAKAYRKLHRGAAEDAVRIREVIKILGKAVRLSKDGFTEQELDLLDQFRRAQSSVDVTAEAGTLSTPNLDSAQQQSNRRSALSDL
ncbi:WXG100 family type VII secretion target [Streptomyces sp. NPDC088252]|uniref:WXG100 family type VII secretion target n=1 Tax=unclassified Streptomyces TaxID=2593676 RepID=UPI00380729CF